MLNLFKLGTKGQLFECPWKFIGGIYRKSCYFIQLPWTSFKQ